jgi:hypothetical protein
MMRDGFRLDRASGLKTKNRPGIRSVFAFGSVIVRGLAGSHIRAFARSTVAAPGPVGRTGFLKADSFLMHPQSWNLTAFRPEFFFAFGLGLLQLVGYQIEILYVVF